MISNSAPVFYDCEASGLDGFVIEIGWAFVDPANGQIASASYLVRPLTEWRIETAWDENAEDLHGISLADLYAGGVPVCDIANAMNRALAGRELYSDSLFDAGWLAQIYDGAGIEPSFTVRQTGADYLLEKAVAERNFDVRRYREVRDEAEQNRRHRAQADALLWAQLWRMVVQNGRGQLIRDPPASG